MLRSLVIAAAIDLLENVAQMFSPLEGTAVAVMLAQKTGKTAQVRGFFNTDSRPDYVVIIRPRQLGPGSTYIIPRSEK